MAIIECKEVSIMAVKASISFGLVYIPVSLHVAVRSNGVDFRLLDKKTCRRSDISKPATSATAEP